MKGRDARKKNEKSIKIQKQQEAKDPPSPLTRQ